jgi:hypothetical protein
MTPQTEQRLEELAKSVRQHLYEIAEIHLELLRMKKAGTITSYEAEQFYEPIGDYMEELEEKFELEDATDPTGAFSGGA